MSDLELLVESMDMKVSQVAELLCAVDPEQIDLGSDPPEVERAERKADGDFSYGAIEGLNGQRFEIIPHG